MGNSYSQGAQSAAALGEFFVAGNMSAGSQTITAAKLTESWSVTDGGGTAFTPDWIIVFGSNQGTTGNAYSTTISGTTAGLVTVTRATSSAAATVYWIAGNLE